MTPEGKVKAAIIKYLKSVGLACWYCMPNAGGYGTGGTPDILACYRGFFLAIEVKRPGNLNGTTPLQETQLKSINTAQGFAIVADDVRMVRDAIKAIDIRMAIMQVRGVFDAENVISRIAA